MSAAHAAVAQEQWQDLYFRHNFADTGQYPTAGSLSQSPDIIPAGLAPYSDPTQLIADDNWVKDFGSSTDASTANYIYLRGRNLGAAGSSGRLYLYFSPGSLLLFPTDPLVPKKGWSKNPLKTSKGAEYVTVDPAADARFVTTEPFLWVPEPISNDHYCLIGRVATEAHPNEIPTTGNLNDFARYISEHPNMAWRNVITRSPQYPTWSTATEYSQGDVGGDVYVFLRVENAPNGSAVEFSSGTPGPEPPLVKGRTTVENAIKDGIPTFVATWYGKIPANFVTNVTYTWFSNGKTPLPDMKVTLEALLPVPSEYWDPELEQYARPLEEFGVDSSTQAGPTKAIRLGSQTIEGDRQRTLLGASDVAEAGASISLAGLTWEQTSSSVLSAMAVDTTMTVERVDEKGVATQVVSIYDAPGAENGASADLTFDADLATGALSGDTFVSLVTKQVPVGCEVWFENLDGSITIKVPPTRVDNSTSFSVATLVSLPADYSTKLRGFLRLNGKTLPGTWSARLSAVHMTSEEAAEFGRRGGEPLGNGGPIPGKLLGAVTVKR